VNERELLEALEGLLQSGYVVVDDAAEEWRFWPAAEAGETKSAAASIRPSSPRVSNREVDVPLPFEPIA